MSRTNRSAKAAGSRMERSTADYLAANVSDLIDRRVKTGAKDKGDISGVRHMGRRVVVEVKDHGGRVKVGPWLNEAEVERGNDDAEVGLVIAKRLGITWPGDQIVLMTVDNLIGLLTGTNPSLHKTGDDSEV